MHRIATALVVLVITAGFYLLLIDTVDTPELYAGAGVVLLAMLVFAASREQGIEEASIPLRSLAGGWRVIVRVPQQILLVCWEALAQLRRPRRARGVFRAVSFAAAGEGSETAGRRALAEALGSLTPNTIVIGIDPDRELLLVHQLHRQGGREELDPLRLG